MDVPTTDFTKVIHHDSYPAISPKRPELSQDGKNVLVTGGGGMIGKEIAQSFAIASAKTVIIIGRTVGSLENAVAELQEFGKTIGSPTKFISRACDVSKNSDVEALWEALASQNLEIDVLVLNAAVFPKTARLAELGIDDVWHQFEANVKGPLFLAEKFQKQSRNGPKFLIHVTSAVIHMLHNPIVASRPGYSLTKASASFAVHLIADSVKPEQMQVIDFHPGMIYGEGWKGLGITEDMLPFDKKALAGSFTVWAASKEARFLHGRYVLANWDVDELAQGENKKSLEENPDFLRLSVNGLRGVMRA